MARTSRADAADFLQFDEARCMNETLGALGFVLLRRPRIWNEGSYFTVRLVWRNATTRDSAQLALRLRAIR